jgi:type IV pilus assembly protein PilA
VTDPSTAPTADKPPRTVLRTLGKALKWVLYVLLGVIGLVVVLGIIGVWPLEVGFYLAFGWIQFAVKNLASAELNRALLAEGIACIVVLGFGTHYFCRWLYREANASAARAWRWQWTASGLAVVLLLFVAGIGTIGVAHQTAWLFNADDPLLVNSWRARARLSEAILAGSGMKTPVAEYYGNTGRLPQNSDEAGIARDTTPVSKLVSSIEIREKGVIVVTLNKDRDWPAGGEITLTPTADAAAKRLSWKCRSTLPPKLLPAACRE